MGDQGGAAAATTVAGQRRYRVSTFFSEFLALGREVVVGCRTRAAADLLLEPGGVFFLEKPSPALLHRKDAPAQIARALIAIALPRFRERSRTLLAMNRHLALARMTSKALLAQLNEFATCDISDALLKLGVPSGGAIPGPTSPVAERSTGRC